MTGGPVLALRIRGKTGPRAWPRTQPTALARYGPEPLWLRSMPLTAGCGRGRLARRIDDARAGVEAGAAGERAGARPLHLQLRAKEVQRLGGDLTGWPGEASDLTLALDQLLDLQFLGALDARLIEHGAAKEVVVALVVRDDNAFDLGRIRCSRHGSAPFM